MLTRTFTILALALAGSGCSICDHGGKELSPSSSQVGPRLESSQQTWVSFDGQRFPYTRWGNSSRPKRVIVGVHGLSGAASDFVPLGEHLEGKSTAVYAIDLRGQGNDPTKCRIGDIKDPQFWFRDLDTFLGLVRRENPGAQLFLYGESLGGLIAVHGFGTLSDENRRAIRGLVLSSPVVSLKDRKDLGRVKYALLKSAIRVLPRRKIGLSTLAGGKQDMQITTGTDHRENLLITPHAVDRYSFRLLGTLEEMIDGSQEKAAQLSLPILVIHPAHDLLTTAEDVEAWYGKLETKDKERHLFSESYHLLLHDKEKEQVLSVVERWLARH